MAAPRQLNIGIATDFFFPRIGGVECHSYSLAETLVKLGHRVVVITGYLSQGRQGVRHLSTGVKVYHLPQPAFYESNVTGSIFFSALAGFRAVALREGLDLVHAHQLTSVLGLEVAKHAKLMGLPTVLTYHSIWDPGSLTASMIKTYTALCRPFIDKGICLFCGLKVVTTNVGGIREIMPDGVMYRCEPTAASVQTALGDVIENYHSLHPRPASDVTQAYDNINVAKRTLAVYEAAMAASQKTGAMEYVMKGQTWMERFNIAIILVIETIMLFVLDWFDPPKEVERAIDYSDVWRQRIDCSR